MKKPLDHDFFARDTVVVAKDLLGKVMETSSNGEIISGIVVEDEAYLGFNDPGSHSFRGITKRNAVMFGPAGVSYIYQIYGIYFCYNVTTDHQDVPAAVLVRALQPLSGIKMMQKLRGKEKIEELCSGPAKLVQAMGITKAMNGTSAINGLVRFYSADLLGSFGIKETTRMGLTQGADLKLRFYVEGNRFVSHK